MSIEMLKIVAELKTKIAALEAMMGAVSKKPAEDKPKKPLSEGMKAWHAFNARIDALLKENNLKFKRVAEAKQFASKLKKEAEPSKWTDEEILAERASWAEEHPATDTESSSEAVADSEEKKAGRPKMTDEEKAAAKLAREAKKAAMTPEEKAAAAAKKAAAKAAREAKKTEEPAAAPAPAPAPAATPKKTVAKKAKKAPDAPKKPETKVAWEEEDLDDELSSAIEAVHLVE